MNEIEFSTLAVMFDFYGQALLSPLVHWTSNIQILAVQEQNSFVQKKLSN